MLGPAGADRSLMAVSPLRGFLWGWGYQAPGPDDPGKGCVGPPGQELLGGWARPGLSRIRPGRVTRLRGLTTPARAVLALRASAITRDSEGGSARVSRILDIC